MGTAKRKNNVGEQIRGSAIRLSVRCGYHILSPHAWIQTTHIAPVSDIPSRRRWATQDGADQIRQMFLTDQQVLCPST